VLDLARLAPSPLLGIRRSYNRCPAVRIDTSWLKAKGSMAMTPMSRAPGGACHEAMPAKGDNATSTGTHQQLSNADPSAAEEDPAGLVGARMVERCLAKKVPSR